MARSPTIEDLERAFNDNPSLGASLQDFEHSDSNELSPRRPPLLGYPSHHSGFHEHERSETESRDSEVDSEMSGGGRFSPPAWRRDERGHRSRGFWRANDGYGNAKSVAGRKRSREDVSREGTPECESANDWTGKDEGDDTLAAAARTRLPTGSASPEKQRSPEPDLHTARGNLKEEEMPMDLRDIPEDNNSYFRFGARLDVQSRTEPIEAAIQYVRYRYQRFYRSWFSMFIHFLVGLLSVIALRTLSQPSLPPPVPDLVKVAGLAKAFEPLIYYSENGVQQIGDLDATGVAVWDLGESVRSTNMTSAPIIVKELDDLSESLKKLSLELTTFFANVDGDVDSILIVMEWARRELTQIATTPRGYITITYDSLHSLLSKIHLIESSSGSSAPTALSTTLSTLFGLSTQQRTHLTLQRTFTAFLNTLEAAIESELTHSLALFRLFASIDQQFLNLARTVIRETDNQESLQDDLLSSLWTRILGPNSSSLHKFERNKKLLSNIKAKTLSNKGVLEDHNRKLLTLKANLEILRRKLVSPLLRGEGSTIGVHEQIRGLEEVGGYLGGVRERQKGRLMEALYGTGERRKGIRDQEGGY